MEMFHSSGAQNDEESHPEGRPLEGNSLIGLSLLSLIIRLENDGVEKQREKAQHKQQLDHEDHQILGVVLHPGARLRNNDLIDVVEIDSPGEQQDDEQNAGDLFIMPIKNIRDGLNLILRYGLLQTWGDRHDEKRETADPNDCGEQMKPMIDDRNQDVEIGRNAFKSIHSQQWEK